MSETSAYAAPAPVNLVELGFMDARSKLLDVAAFLDRVDRAGQQGDYRVKALREAMKHLSDTGTTRVKEMLLTFSDPTEEPIPAAEIQGAFGAWKQD